MRRSQKHRTGIRTPALVGLALAVALLLGHRAGGSSGADALLTRLASSERFITRTFAFETGVPSGQSEPVHNPYAAQDKTSTPVPAVSETGLPEIPEPAIEVSSSPVKRAASVEMNNESGLYADPNAMLRTPIEIDCTGKQPTVLIYHTHATEAYTPSGADTYLPSGDYRTTDVNQNVVRVGTELANALESHGIGVIHLTDLFDNPSYNGSYGLSLASMKEVLAEYPTIQVTIDVHRDAVIRDDGSQYRTEAVVDGQTIAQLMLVVGTNASGLEHPNWRQNLNFAANLQADLEGTYPGLMRPINLRRQRFNEHLRPGGLLLEVGSSGNTLQEALAAARLFGDALAARIAPGA